MPTVDQIRRKAKNAREALRHEIKVLGWQIKTLEKENSGTHITSSKASALSMLRKRATVIGMAIALYHNRLHVLSFVTKNRNKIHLTLESQANYLSTVVENFTPFGNFRVLNNKQLDNIDKILKWHVYKVKNPLQKQSYIIDLEQALKNS
jgi:hypothetical protein